jgi:predicted hotdog family 3-hydroxylacyl-ACP dehydratase
MFDIDIDSLIPHRGKIKVISTILDIKEGSAASMAVVNAEWPLYEGGAVNSLVLIEAIAQTAAIIEGYKRKQRGESAVKGWLVGIKSAEFTEEKIPVNTNLVIQLESKYAFDNYGVVEGVVKTGEKVWATAILQAMCLNNDDNQQ